MKKEDLQTNPTPGDAKEAAVHKDVNVGDTEKPVAIPAVQPNGEDVENSEGKLS